MTDNDQEKPIQPDVEEAPALEPVIPQQTNQLSFEQMLELLYANPERDAAEQSWLGFNDGNLEQTVLGAIQKKEKKSFILNVEENKERVAIYEGQLNGKKVQIMLRTSEDGSKSVWVTHAVKSENPPVFYQIVGENKMLFLSALSQLDKKLEKGLLGKIWDLIKSSFNGKQKLLMNSIVDLDSPEKRKRFESLLRKNPDALAFVAGWLSKGVKVYIARQAMIEDNVNVLGLFESGHIFGTANPGLMRIFIHEFAHSVSNHKENKHIASQTWTRFFNSSDSQKWKYPDFLRVLRRPAYSEFLNDSGEISKANQFNIADEFFARALEVVAFGGNSMTFGSKVIELSAEDVAFFRQFIPSVPVAVDQKKSTLKPTRESPKEDALTNENFSDNVRGDDKKVDTDSPSSRVDEEISTEPLVSEPSPIDENTVGELSFSKMLELLYSNPQRDEVEKGWGEPNDGDLEKTVVDAIQSKKKQSMLVGEGLVQDVLLYEGQLNGVPVQIMVKSDGENKSVWVTHPTKSETPPIFYQMQGQSKEIILSALSKGEKEKQLGSGILGTIWGGVKSLFTTEKPQKSIMKPWIDLDDPKEKEAFESALKASPMAMNFVMGWIKSGVNPNISQQVMFRDFNGTLSVKGTHFKGQIFRGEVTPDYLPTFIHEFSHAVFSSQQFKSSAQLIWKRFFNNSDPAAWKYSGLAKLFTYGNYAFLLDESGKAKEEMKILIADEFFARVIEMLVMGKDSVKFTNKTETVEIKISEEDIQFFQQFIPKGSQEALDLSREASPVQNNIFKIMRALGAVEKGVDVLQANRAASSGVKSLLEMTNQGKTIFEGETSRSGNLLVLTNQNGTLREIFYLDPAKNGQWVRIKETKENGAVTGFKKESFTLDAIAKEVQNKNLTSQMMRVEDGKLFSVQTPAVSNPVTENAAQGVTAESQVDDAARVFKKITSDPSNSAVEDVQQAVETAAKLKAVSPLEMLNGLENLLLEGTQLVPGSAQGRSIGRVVGADGKTQAIMVRVNNSDWLTYSVDNAGLVTQSSQYTPENYPSNGNQFNLFTWRDNTLNQNGKNASNSKGTDARKGFINLLPLTYLASLVVSAFGILGLFEEAKTVNVLASLASPAILMVFALMKLGSAFSSQPNRSAILTNEPPKNETVDASKNLTIETRSQGTKLTLAGGVPAFLPETNNDNEQFFARQVKQNASGANISQGRELRQLTFSDRPDLPTDTLKEIASVLSFIRAQDPTLGISNNAGAVRVIRQLLQSGTYQGWMGQINVGALLSEPKVAEYLSGSDIEGNLSRLSLSLNKSIANLTLADVASASSDVQGTKAFQNFVYALVAFNAEVLSTPRGGILTEETLKKLKSEMGNFLIQHTHPDAVNPGAMDRATALRLARFGLTHGISGLGLPQLISSPAGLTIYDSNGVQSVVTKSGKISSLFETGRLPDIKPSNKPYVSLILGGDFLSSFMKFISRLSPTLAIYFMDKFKMGRSAGNQNKAFMNEGDRAQAKELLNLVGKMKDLDSVNLRRFWNAAGLLATNQWDNKNLNNFLKNEGAALVSYKDLIGQLATQMQKTALQQGLQTLDLAKQGQAAVLGTAVRQFGDVVAFPAELNSVLSRLGEISQLATLSPQDAAKRAQVLRNNVQKGNDDSYVDELLSLSGRDSETLVRNLEKAAIKSSSGRFYTTSDIRDILTGKINDNEARLVLLNLLVNPISRAIVSVLKLSSDQADLAGKLNIEIVSNVSDLRGEITAGKAAIIPSENLIQIFIDPSMNGREAVLTAVGRLAHELGHFFGSAPLAKQSYGRLGVPTVLEEAIVNFLTHKVVHDELGLEAIAEPMLLEVFESIANTSNRKAIFTPFRDLNNDSKAVETLKARAKQSAGIEEVGVLAVNEEEYQAALRVFANSGVQVLLREDLSGLPMMAGETSLEAYGRLYLGTRNIRFLSKQAVDADSVWASLLSPMLKNGSLGSIEMALVVVIGSLPLGQVLDETFNAQKERLIKQQA
ncbi:MAG: hypothetical protein ACKVQC_00430 [Elusimicrobiota bacterium]